MFRNLLRSLCDAPLAMDGLEPRAMLAGDFAISVGRVKVSEEGNRTPTIQVPVTIRNVGATSLSGGGSVDYFLSADRTLDDSDFRFASQALPKLVGAGKSSTLTLNTTKPAPLDPAVGLPLASGDYFIIARLVPKVAGADINPDNNTGVATNTIHISYQFGRVGEKSLVPMAVTLANGTSATFFLQGPGTGQLVNVDGRLVLLIDGSTFATSVIVTPGPRSGSITVAGITVNGALEDLTAPQLNLSGGDLSVLAAGKIVLRNVANANINIRLARPDTAVTLAKVVDSSLTTSTPLRGLSVQSWRDTDSTPDTITAPWITNLSSAGDFEAGLRATSSHKTFAIGNVGVGGHISGIWSVNGNMNQIAARSLASSWGATVRGNINSISVRQNAGGSLAAASGIRRLEVGGDLVNAKYMAGADFGNNGQLDGSAIDDFFQAGHIGVVRIMGRMINSEVTAGLSTQDAVIGNSDDQLDPSSAIETIFVNHAVNNSHFRAAKLPTKATLQFKQVKTASNPIFVSS
jgi:hypothetical protein